MTLNDFYISTDKAKLDLEMMTDYLGRRSYWAKGRSLETVTRTVENSLCFGVYTADHQQVGFARVVTDYAVFAWVMDVFVLEDYRGLGLSKMLMKEMTEHPALQTLSRWGLATADAHRLYEQFGFRGLSRPENVMEKL